MSICIWRGDADARANVWWAIPADVHVGDTFTLTINHKKVTVQAAEATVANVVELLIVAVGESRAPEWAEVAATTGYDEAGNVTHVVLTGPFQGIPVTITGTTGSAVPPEITVTTLTPGFAGANQRQTITLAGATGGTFTLTFGGDTTSALAYNASAATIETALTGLTAIGSGNATVTGSAGGPWTVEFEGVFAHVDQDLITGDGTSLTKASGTYGVQPTIVVQGSAGQNNIQMVALNADATGGTFTLSFGGDTTSALAYNASAATVESALESLTAIGSGNVAVTGEARGPWYVEFMGDFARVNQAPLTGNGANLTGSVSSIRIESSQEGRRAEQRYACRIVAKGTPFRMGLYRQSLGTTVYTEYLNEFPTAAEMQAALESLVGIGAGNVRVIGPSADPAGGSLTFYTIYGTTLSYPTVQLVSDPSDSNHVRLTNWSTFAAQTEKQLLYYGQSTGGTYTLSFRGQTTSWLAYNAAASAIQTALEALTTIGTGNATVTDVSDTVKLVEFVEDLAYQDVPLLTVDTSSLTGGGVNVYSSQLAVADTDEIQMLTITGHPRGGAFTLSFEGQTTGTIAYNAAASAVQTALQALSTIGSGNALVSGSAGGPWLVKFVGDLGGTNVPFLTGDGSSLSGAMVDVAVTQASAPPVNEIQQVTQTGSPASSGTFTLTFDGETTAAIPYNASAVALQAALEALTSIGTGNVYVSGSAAGPWTVGFVGSLAATDVDTMTADADSLVSPGTQTLTLVEKITATGPYWFTDPTNWSTQTVPVDGDTIVFEHSDVSCLFGITQPTLTPARLVIDSTFTGQIGMASWNGNGYYEYRPQYLRIGDPSDSVTLPIDIGEGDAAGSGRIKIDNGACPVTLTIHQLAGAVDADFPAMCWKGTASSNTIRIYKGTLGIAVNDSGETSSVNTLVIGYVANQAGDAEVLCGDLVTLGTVTKTGGVLVVGGESGVALGSLTQLAGETTINGTDGVTVLVVRGGEVVYNTTGTLAGNPRLSGESLLDFSKDLRVKTVTNPIDVYGDLAIVRDPFGSVTNLRINWQETTRVADVGTNFKLTRGSI